MSKACLKLIDQNLRSRLSVLRLLSTANELIGLLSLSCSSFRANCSVSVVASSFHSEYLTHYRRLPLQQQELPRQEGHPIHAGAR